MPLAAPYFDEGTISVDPGDPTIIIGHGTLWSTVGLPNDEIESLGVSLSIKEFIDDTHARTFYGWPGTLPSNAPYILKFRSELRAEVATLTEGIRAQINRLRIFDRAVAIFSVEQFAVNTPPEDAIVGDRYVVGTAGVSDFAGHNNEIAEKTETGYLFTIPQHGYHVIDKEQNLVRSWNETSWSSGIGLGASIQYAKAWNEIDLFKSGNVVTHNDRIWIANFDNANSEPAPGNPDWSIFLEVGEDGGAFTLRYVFNADTDDSSPGEGNLKFNNAPGSATIIRVSKADIYGNDWSELIAGIATSTTSIQKGKIRVVAKGDKTKQVIATVMNGTLVADDYFNITISGVQASLAALADGDDVVFIFSERGDKGATGDQGSQGYAPVLAIVADGERRVLKIIDWTGSTGTKPPANKFVGALGLVDTAAEAIDIRGIQGIEGPIGPRGLGIEPDASGTFAQRDGYDEAAAGFKYLQTDSVPFLLYVKNSASTADWSLGSPIGGVGDMLNGDNLAGIEDDNEALNNLGAGETGKALFRAADAETAKSVLSIQPGLPDGDRQNAAIERIYLSKLLESYFRASDAVAWGFKSSAGIDAANSSAYSLNASDGKISPSAAYDERSSATTGASATSTGYTIFDRSWVIDNGEIITKVGVYSTVAGSLKVKIGLENTSTSYDVVASEGPFSHTGSGWEFFVLSSPFVVPGSGNYRAGFYFASGGMTAGTPTLARAFKAGDVTGTSQTGFSNAAGGMMATGVMGPPNNMTLVTSSLPLDGEVVKARALVLFDPIDNVDLNVDLQVEISCNGGTDWFDGSLVSISSYVGEASDLHSLAETENVECAAGSSIKARLKTLNGKTLDVYGLALQTTGA